MISEKVFDDLYLDRIEKDINDVLVRYNIFGIKDSIPKCLIIDTILTGNIEAFEQIVKSGSFDYNDIFKASNEEQVQL